MSRLTLPISTLLLLFSLCPALGEETSRRSVTAQGTATIKRPAERMRLSLQLLVRDKDIQKAAAALQERTRGVRDELVALGAVPASIQIGDPAIEANQSSMQRQLQQRLMASRGRRKPKDEPAPLITLQAPLQADWLVTHDDPYQRLARVYEIQQAIRSAGFSGKDSAEELSEEEQELLEEAQMFSMYSSDDQSPGEPRFFFLAEIPASTVEGIRKEAFEKAQARAVELAKAANVTLGDLLVLQGSNSSQDSMFPSRSMFLYMQNENQGAAMLTPEEIEKTAVGASPGDLTFSVDVTATFEIR